jgi:hypothetical protein
MAWLLSTQVRRTASCYKSVHKLSTSCVRTACSQLLEQVWNKLCNKLDGIIRLAANIVLTSLIQSWYNKNVTKLTTQGCNNIVISRRYQTCWNNLATSLITSTRLLQVVNSLFQTCWQLGTSIANTTCWRLVGRLLTICEIFTLVYTRKNLTTCQQDVFATDL